MTTSRLDPNQTDLFIKTRSAVRLPYQPSEWSKLHYQLAMAMKKAAEECGKQRHQIAFGMAEILGDEEISKATLDAYISAAKTTHNISVLRFLAFVHATEADWLIDEIAKPIGLTVIGGEEAQLVDRMRLRQKIEGAQKRLKSLKDLEKKLASLPSKSDVAEPQE